MCSLVAVGAFTDVTGIIVLGGTLTVTYARRSRQVALLKAIGITWRDVVTVFTIEYALTGAVAASAAWPLHRCWSRGRDKTPPVRGP